MSFTWWGSLPGRLSDEGSEDAQALAEEGRDLHVCDCGALVPGPYRQAHADFHRVAGSVVPVERRYSPTEVDRGIDADDLLGGGTA